MMREGTMLAWLWTVAAALAGVWLFLRSSQVLAGVLLLLSAIAACPLSVSLAERQSGLRLSGGLRAGIALLFAGLAALGIAQNPAALSQLLPHRPPPAPSPAKTLMAASGDFGNQTSKPFTTQGADWNREWSFDCASLGDSGNFSVKVTRTDGSVLASVEKINDRDSGTEHYHQAGTFHLQIVSECRWNVRASG
jgi:hypothetical protein